VEAVFSVDPCRGCIWRIVTQLSQSRVEGLERVCRKRAQSEPEAVVRQSPLVEMRELEEPQ
jgi:hypothetical protein